MDFHDPLTIAICPFLVSLVANHKMQVFFDGQWILNPSNRFHSSFGLMAIMATEEPQKVVEQKVVEQKVSQPPAEDDKMVLDNDDAPPAVNG